MAASWSGLQSALEAAIAATWSQVKPPSGGGIWNADRVARIDFDKVHAPSGTLKYPYAVIEMGDAPPAGAAPITAKVAAVEVTLHYLTRVEEGGSVAGEATLRDRLEAMEDYLQGTGLGSYPVMEGTTFTLPDRHPANLIFRQSDLPWLAGAVTVTVWVGES
jgi:hypothetical protein